MTLVNTILNNILEKLNNDIRNFYFNAELSIMMSWMSVWRFFTAVQFMNNFIYWRNVYEKIFFEFDYGACDGIILVAIGYCFR